MVVRGQDDQIRALSRVCLHKYADVLGERRCRAATSSASCARTLWSYGLDGKLNGAPFMRDSKLFEREGHTYRLPEFRVAVGRGSCS